MSRHTSGRSEKPYSPPLDRLLSCGDPRPMQDRPDYLAMGFGAEHIPELIRMATDEKLNNSDSDSLEVWAPLHAWRTLGQLRAEAAIEPLVGLFARIDRDEDDWVSDDLPMVFGEIGLRALPALSGYLADPSHGLESRLAAAHGIMEIGTQHAESRDQCVAALSHQLEQFKKNSRNLNGALISLLLDLDAVEAGPLMEQAFAAKKVDESVAGDWEEVQLALGRGEEDEIPGKFSVFAGLKRILGLSRQDSGSGSRPSGSRSSKED